MARHIPDDDLASEVADLLQAVTHRARREGRDDGTPSGITPAQMRALRTLQRSPSAMRMSALADELQIARRSATSLVDALEARRLVTRRHDPSDRRAVTVVVTAAGTRLIAEARARHRRSTIGLLGPLSATELRTLRSLLGRIVG